MAQVLNKRTDESKLYDMDFSGTNVLRTGDNIASVKSLTATPSGLTIGSSSISGQKIQFNVSGGVNGSYYLIKAVVVTNSGDEVPGEGILYVRDASINDEQNTVIKI